MSFRLSRKIRFCRLNAIFDFFAIKRTVYTRTPHTLDRVQKQLSKGACINVYVYKYNPEYPNCRESRYRCTAGQGRFRSGATRRIGRQRLIWWDEGERRIKRVNGYYLRLFCFFVSLLSLRIIPKADTHARTSASSPVRHRVVLKNIFVSH